MMTLLGFPFADVQGAAAARLSWPWLVLLCLAFSTAASLLLVWAGRPGGIDEAVIDPDDLITDAAVDLLVEADHGEYGHRYKSCPGCTLDVWREELRVHARECTPLRELVQQPH